ncbi:MAG: hypothetical protein U0235_24055 [Polyangiaceae bacterium]
MWKTIDKAKLKDRRGEYELEVVSLAHEMSPASTSWSSLIAASVIRSLRVARHDRLGLRHPLSPAHHGHGR